jgi:hypothetical protein
MNLKNAVVSVLFFSAKILTHLRRDLINAARMTICQKRGRAGEGADNLSRERKVKALSKSRLLSGYNLFIMVVSKQQL